MSTEPPASHVCIPCTYHLVEHTLVTGLKEALAVGVGVSPLALKQGWHRAGTALEQGWTGEERRAGTLLGPRLEKGWNSAGTGLEQAWNRVRTRLEHH